MLSAMAVDGAPPRVSIAIYDSYVDIVLKYNPPERALKKQ